jgi:hypothetical protein
MKLEGHAVELNNVALMSQDGGNVVVSSVTDD